MDELNKLYEELYSVQQAIEDFPDDEDYCNEMYEWLDYLRDEIETLEEKLKNEKK